MGNLLKPLTWTLLTILFGLLQLWCVLLWSYLDQNGGASSLEIIKDCGLLFFCTAIMSAIALDYLTSTKKTRNISLIGVIYILPPVLCLILSILIYAVFYYGSPTISIATNFQFVIFAFCATYITVVKYLEFNNIIK